MSRFILIISSLLCLLCFNTFAVAMPKSNTIIAPYQMKSYDADIDALYASLPASTADDFSQRIADISQAFVGKPYVLGALGEGPAAVFDQEPLYRTDAFDCVTYVSTVLALAEAKDLTQFKTLIRQIRYANGVATFKERNHFMSVDWNKNNSYKGYVRDITYKFVDSKGKPIARVANAVINKPSWYQHLPKAQIKVTMNLGLHRYANLYNALRDSGNGLQQERSVLLYLPLTKLFNKQGLPNKQLLKQIPNGAIVEVVRPNWNLSKKAGTHMNVSHLGFAIKNGTQLMYREASSDERKVIDIPLTQYLKKYLKSKTVKGINIQLPVWQDPKALWKKLTAVYDAGMKG
jgi:N-acetylmuramoyl-L-alanine amidase-like